MTRRGLVLGGGGLVGLAWERGLTEGLAEGGIDLREADVFVGTSAGSLIGSRLAAGHDFRTDLGSEILGDPPMAEGGVDIAAAGAVMQAWLGMEDATREGCARVGAESLRARTAPEQTWVSHIGAALSISEWPEKDLRISVVDTRKGERRLLDRNAGAPIDRAVAASCSVPGLFPGIEIEGERYMDGGVWSGTHADVLVDDPPALVVAIAPLVEGVVAFGRQMERALDAECRALETAGCRIERILPEAADREAIGPDLMDGTRVQSVTDFARDRGHRIAREGRLDWV